MTNFNSLNNININQMLGNIQRNIAQQQAQIVQQNQNQTPQQQTQNLLQQNLMYDQAVIYSPDIFSFEVFRMDNETITKYLQNLLNLPNSIDKFVKELDSKNLNPKALNVLVENMVNLKALGELLNQNSKEAVQKLLETIAMQSKTTGASTEQLKEMLGVLTSIQTSTAISSNALKDLLLLYIPIDFQAFNKDVDFEGIEEEDKQKAQNATLSIMIETINFSNILCILNEVENSLYIEISANENFTFDRFKKIIEVLSKEANLKTYVEFKPNRKQLIKNAKQNFKVVSGGFIPTNILILTHIIVKTIFKIDNDFSE